jgi:glycosyltransferase involved in cell wall biosynthesis
LKLAFITHYSNLYGANRSLLDLIDGLSKLGIKSLVISPKFGDLNEELMRRKIPFIIYKFNSWCKPSHSLTNSPLKRIKRSIDRFAITKQERNANKRSAKLISENIYHFNPDAIYSNSSVIDIGVDVANNLGKPHIWHLRELVKKFYNLDFSGSKRYISRRFNSADLIIANSNSVKNFFEEIIDKKIEVVYNGVISSSILNNLSFTPPNTGSSKKVNFGIIGHIHPNKGQKQAILAFKDLVEEFDECKLLLAGDGELKYLNKLKGIVSDYQVKNVEFLGFQKDPFSFYKRIDVLLMCSIHEALGRVTLEAMASSIPVIGNRGDGTSEIIEDQKTGLFYSGDVNELLDKMIFMVNNPKKRNDFGNNSKTKVGENFTIETYAEQIHTLLKKRLF